ncbi:hypothetical protein PoB_002491300 [Plakobranchus ocellatus]|uniref:Uncharacterized protein n=1 Tax=Plakobranchus ocellatus TaxID=259542 RepID=A0AAV3ZVE8_9GAST|nr:hypothetical protein PoB_002491300 [Plakobranchus ocellatus]
MKFCARPRSLRCVKIEICLQRLGRGRFGVLDFRGQLVQPSCRRRQSRACVVFRHCVTVCVGVGAAKSVALRTAALTEIMRPAVHASILSSRTQAGSRHRANQRHQFSGRRLLIMVLCGVLLFIPGLALTVVGLEGSDKEDTKVNSRVQFVYRAVGPLMCAVGALVMFASCIYFYCYGTGPQGPGGQHHDVEHDGGSGTKGTHSNSSRSKSHHSSHHSHHHQSHHHYHHNGRAVDIASGDGECRLSLRNEAAHSSDPTSSTSGSHHSKNNRRATGVATAAEEEVPLAKMEDSFDLNAKGHQGLLFPQVIIHVQEPSDSELDFDYADKVSRCPSLSNGSGCPSLSNGSGGHSSTNGSECHPSTNGSECHSVSNGIK